MAWNAEEMQPRRQGIYDLLHGFQMRAVFYHQNFLRSQLFQGVDRLGEVRVRDLHFVDFVKVCFRPVERIVIEHPPNIAISPDRSNDYSRNVGITSSWKALLLNKVVVGKGMKLTQDDTTLTQPPSGYDSVSIFGLVHNEDIDQGLGSCRSGPWRISELR